VCIRVMRLPNKRSWTDSSSTARCGGDVTVKRAKLHETAMEPERPPGRSTANNGRAEASVREEILCASFPLNV
jgi:hypothetical protein